eukprot:Lithocolla_globosa_v1_NODE_27_length_9260_cov_179.654861.p8 type:complete len:106 gc:universal NODE_27_length_9260_cov_179.654861:1098-1415(+)
MNPQQQRVSQFCRGEWEALHKGGDRQHTGRRTRPQKKEEAPSEHRLASSHEALLRFPTQTTGDEKVYSYLKENSYPQRAYPDIETELLQQQLQGHKLQKQLKNYS